MTLDEARTLLNGCDRDELRDHAFGDREMSWWRKGTYNTDNPVEIASGYQGGGTSVTIGKVRFEGTDAYALLGCGTLVRADRNDTTGDDHFAWRP